MRILRRGTYALLLMALAACGRAGETNTGTNFVSNSENLSEPAEETFAERPDALPTEAEIQTAVAGNGAALWGHVKGSERWTDTTLSIFRNRQADFEQARDIENFCPDYHRASQGQKEACWLRLVSAVVLFESGFNPRATYREANGRYSIGLFSLSSGECREASSSSALKEPVANLKCGMRMMADLISRDDVIENAPPRRGAAAYWSVLRRPYGHGKRRHGKRERVIDLTKGYRAFAVQ